MVIDDEIFEEVDAKRQNTVADLAAKLRELANQIMESTALYSFR